MGRGDNIYPLRAYNPYFFNMEVKGYVFLAFSFLWVLFSTCCFLLGTSLLKLFSFYMLLWVLGFFAIYYVFQKNRPNFLFNASLSLPLGYSIAKIVIWFFGASFGQVIIVLSSIAIFAFFLKNSGIEKSVFKIKPVQIAFVAFSFIAAALFFLFSYLPRFAYFYDVFINDFLLKINIINVPFCNDDSFFWGVGFNIASLFCLVLVLSSISDNFWPHDNIKSGVASLFALFSGASIFFVSQIPPFYSLFILNAVNQPIYLFSMVIFLAFLNFYWSAKRKEFLLYYLIPLVLLMVSAVALKMELGIIVLLGALGVVFAKPFQKREIKNDEIFLSLSVIAAFFFLVFLKRVGGDFFNFSIQPFSILISFPEYLMFFVQDNFSLIILNFYFDALLFFVVFYSYRILAIVMVLKRLKRFKLVCSEGLFFYFMFFASMALGFLFKFQNFPQLNFLFYSYVILSILGGGYAYSMLLDKNANIFKKVFVAIVVLSSFAPFFSFIFL